MLRCYTSDHFVLPLPPGHRFPMAKYRLLREHIEAGLADRTQLCIAEPAARADLVRAHCPDYVDRVLGGTLSERELKRIGFPWSPAVAQRTTRVSSTVSVGDIYHTATLWFSAAIATSAHTAAGSGNVIAGHGTYGVSISGSAGTGANQVLGVSRSMAITPSLPMKVTAVIRDGWPKAWARSPGCSPRIASPTSSSASW